jgi:hypothetical protein
MASMLRPRMTGRRSLAGMAAAAVGVVAMAIGGLLVGIGAFLAFPMVITILLFAIGLWPNTFTVAALIAGLLCATLGFGLMLAAPRLTRWIHRRMSGPGAPSVDTR